MGETEKYNFIVMLGESVNGFLGIEVPADDVRVLSTLAGCEHMA